MSFCQWQCQFDFNCAVIYPLNNNKRRCVVYKHKQYEKKRVRIKGTENESKSSPVICVEDYESIVGMAEYIKLIKYAPDLRVHPCNACIVMQTPLLCCCCSYSLVRRLLRWLIAVRNRWNRGIKRRVLCNLYVFHRGQLVQPRLRKPKRQVRFSESSRQKEGLASCCSVVCSQTQLYHGIRANHPICKLVCLCRRFSVKDAIPRSVDAVDFIGSCAKH